MTEIEYRISDLINFSSNQKPVEFQNAFNSLIGDKVADAIALKKIEVAQSMLNGSEDTEEESEE
mgnify:CR=1 FL=1